MRDKLDGLFFSQHTINRPVGLSGVGIHSGAAIDLRLLPAPVDSGVVFRRTDCRGMEIKAVTGAVTSLDLATTLGRDDVTISTVEHLLAAVRWADIDNLTIELNGPEVPIVDGSALPFVRLLEAAGVKPQPASRRVLAITAPFSLRLENEKKIRVSPYPGLRLTYAVDFPIASIGAQKIDLLVDRRSFARELAPARTFCLLSEVEEMRRRGLALGGDRDNCVVFGDDGPCNTKTRFNDEPVRHKALDALGDLALAGAPLWAHLEVERGGHQLHFALLEELAKRPECWTWIHGSAPELPERDAPHDDEGQVPLALLSRS